MNTTAKQQINSIDNENTNDNLDFAHGTINNNHTGDDLEELQVGEPDFTSVSDAVLDDFLEKFRSNTSCKS